MPPVLDHLPMCCMWGINPHRPPRHRHRPHVINMPTLMSEWVNHSVCGHLNGRSIHILFQHVMLMTQVGLWHNLLLLKTAPSYKLPAWANILQILLIGHYTSNYWNTLNKPVSVNDFWPLTRWKAPQATPSLEPPRFCAVVALARLGSWSLLGPLTKDS